MALVFGAIVANRWFVTQRGLVTGIFSAANATGQLVFLPVIVALAAGPGWRAAALVVTVATRAARAAGAAGPGRQPRGRRHHAVRRRRRAHRRRSRRLVPAPVDADAGCRGVRAGALAVRTLRESSRSKVFWILVGTFWICGWSTNGLIQTHLIPAAHDHGMPPSTAAGLLAVIGVFDIVGTVGSGWLTDRMDPRLLLFVYYWFRGLSLLVVPWLLGPVVAPAAVGLHRLLRPGLGGHRPADGRAVPAPTSAWSAPASSSAGCSPRTWSGAGVAASFAGWVRESSGDYFGAWMTAGGLCLVAAFACLAIAKPVRAATPVPG